VPAVAGRAVLFVLGELLRGRPSNAAAVFRGAADTLRGRRAR
jgi:hypothetical protein